MSEEFDDFFGGAVDDFFLGGIEDGFAAVAEEVGGFIEGGLAGIAEEVGGFFKGGADDVEDFLNDLVTDLGEGGAVFSADVFEGKGGERDFNVEAEDAGVDAAALDLEVFNDDFFGGFIGGGIVCSVLGWGSTGTGKALGEGFDIVLKVLEVGALKGLLVADFWAVDMYFFNDDGIAGEAGGFDVDQDFAEFEDIFALVALRVTDLETGDGTTAGSEGEVDRFNADRRLGDFGPEGINGGGDALIEDAGTEEEEADDGDREEAEEEEKQFFKHNM